MPKHLSELMISTSLILITIGLFIHCSTPSIVKVNGTTIKPGELYIKHIKINQGLINSNIHVYISLESNYSYQDNYTVLFLSQIELDRLINENLSLMQLTPLLEIKTVDGEPLKEGSYLFTNDVDFYFVVSTKDSKNLYFSYYFSLMPETYDIGLYIMIIGLFLLVGLAVHSLVGYKRILALGVGVNSFVFPLRIVTLKTTHILPSILIELFDLEAYQDFNSVIYWIDILLTSPTSIYSSLPGYVYTPLYIVTIIPFGLIPFIPIWKLGLPIFLYNIGIGYLVYLTAKQISSEREAIYSMALHFFNPITLFYGSFLWLNPPAFVFYLLLAYYLVIREKYSYSMIALGISVMYKQFSLFFLPVMLLIILYKQELPSNRDRLRIGVIYTGIHGLVITLISVPFLIIDYNGFINTLLLNPAIPFPNQGWLSIMLSVPLRGWPITFATFFVVMGFPGIINSIIAYLTLFYILLGSSIIACYLILWKQLDTFTGEKNDVNITKMLNKSVFWSLILSMCLFLFFPRGSYKYYLILTIPFLALSLKQIRTYLTNLFPEKEDLSKLDIKIAFLVLLGLSMIIVLICRHIYFMIIFLLVIILTIIVKRGESKAKLIDN